MYNTFGRTKENKKRLRLKSFFKRVFRIELTVPNINQEVIRTNNSYCKGSSASSLSKSRNESSFTYTLAPLKEVEYMYNNRIRFKGRFERTYNKPQLKGKLVTFNGKQYRII